MTFLEKVEALHPQILYPKTLARLITVQFDQHCVRVRTSARLGLQWNQRFGWSEILAACRIAAGGDSMDILFLDLRDRDEPARMPLEAAGAESFCWQLMGRGILPIEMCLGPRARVTRHLGLHCPPPEYADEAIQVS